MTSPSSSVSMRMMPCMAGCCGPTPSCMVWLPPPAPALAPSPSMNSRRVTLSAIASGLRSDERLPSVDRVVLAQRMAHELLVQEQPTQVGMVLESDAEHVPHFTLEPVRDRPESDGARHQRRVFLDLHLHPDAVILRNRIQVIDDLEARAVFAARKLRVVDRRQVHEHVELERRLVAT